MKLNIDISQSAATGHLYAESRDLQGFHTHAPTFVDLARHIVETIAFIHDRKGTPASGIRLVIDAEALTEGSIPRRVWAEYAVETPAAA